MSFRFDNLRNLGLRVKVTIPLDDEGYLGRECPGDECKGYFKVKPGTGLTGEDYSQCHCPYCGSTSDPDHFYTPAQIEYAKSVVMRQVGEAVTKDLRKLEFDHKPRGPLGIGISMTLKPGQPLPLRYYREEQLETHVTCKQCTLDYAVYGVFAYCPDCGSHNSLQILLRNLDLVRKQLELAAQLDDADLRRHLREDALENCVSSFDGFAREACRLRASSAKDPEAARKWSFQNLNRVAPRLSRLFGIDLRGSVPADVWREAHLGFMRRHAIAHNSGVADQQYLDETGDDPRLLGRKLEIADETVIATAAATALIGEQLLNLLPPLIRSESPAG